MQIAPPSRQSLLRYLLRELDEAEREKIDTLLITDAEYHARFQEVEYDLVDALSAGELSPGEADRVRLALGGAEGLALQLSPSRLQRKVPVGIFKRRLTAMPVFWFAAAALILAAITLGLNRMRVQPAASPNDRAVVAQPSIGNRAEGASGPWQAEPTRSSAGVKPIPEASKESHRPVMAMLLLPGATRSAGMLRLHIPHGAEAVRLDWPAPAMEERPKGFRLQVLNDTGKVFCTSGGRVPNNANRPQGTTVHFVCPAHDVPAGVDFVRIAAAPFDPEAPSLLEVTVSVEKDL